MFKNIFKRQDKLQSDLALDGHLTFQVIRGPNYKPTKTEIVNNALKAPFRKISNWTGGVSERRGN